jgi:hypothetical protein
MGLTTYYPAFINSPQTEIVSAITTAETTIDVTTTTGVFPDAPNLAILGLNSAAETILYTGLTATSLTGITRGFQGTATSWSAGTKIARYYTAYDHDTANTNTTILDTQMMWGGI